MLSTIKIYSIILVFSLQLVSTGENFSNRLLVNIESPAVEIGFPEKNSD